MDLALIIDGFIPQRCHQSAATEVGCTSTKPCEQTNNVPEFAKTSLNNVKYKNFTEGDGKRDFACLKSQRFWENCQHKLNTEVPEDLYSQKYIPAPLPVNTDRVTRIDDQRNGDCVTKTIPAPILIQNSKLRISDVSYLDHDEKLEALKSLCMLRIGKGNVFCCELCQRKFHRKSDLSRHLCIHFNIRPHICGVCNRSFIQKGALTTHIRSHFCKSVHSTHTNSFRSVSKANNHDLGTSPYRI